MGAGQDHGRRPRAAARAGLQPLTPGEAHRLDVAPARVERWVAGFVDRHGPIEASVLAGVLHLSAADGSTADLEPSRPFVGAAEAGEDPATVDGPTLVPRFAAAAAAPAGPGGRLALLLVRRGGYAVGVVEDGRLTASKVGSRYVQSRTAAGGWSQQRFARRRDNQAAGLLDTVAATAVRLVLGQDGRTAPSGLLVVTGGDRALADRLLADPRLSALVPLRSARHLEVPDPRADVLRRAVDQALAVRVTVVNR